MGGLPVARCNSCWHLALLERVRASSSVQGQIGSYKSVFGFRKGCVHIRVIDTFWISRTSDVPGRARAQSPGYTQHDHFDPRLPMQTPAGRRLCPPKNQVQPVAQSPWLPTSSPPPPKVPKIKMYLKGFMTRKKKQREEEQAQAAALPSPSMPRTPGHGWKGAATPVDGVRSTQSCKGKFLSLNPRYIH